MACTTAELEAARRYREKKRDDPEHRAKAVQRMRRWREANPERARENDRQHAKRVRAHLTPEQRALRAERNAAHQAANRERAREVKRAAQLRRRARLLGRHVEDVDPAIVFERDGGICGICGTATDPAAWHLDHVIPLARGGEHSYANAQVAHPSCNRRKGAS